MRMHGLCPFALMVAALAVAQAGCGRPRCDAFGKRMSECLGMPEAQGRSSCDDLARKTPGWRPNRCLSEDSCDGFMECITESVKARKPLADPGTGSTTPPITPVKAPVPATIVPILPARATTMKDLLDGERPADGTTLEFEGVVLFDTVHRFSQTGKDDRYFVLAVAQDSAYLARVAELKARMGEITEDVARLPKLVKKEKEFNEVLDRFNGFADEVEGLRPDLSGAVAIELAGFESVSGRHDWKTIWEQSDSPAMPMWLGLPDVPFQLPPMPDFPTIEGAEARMDALEASDPPDLSAELPNLGLIFVSSFDGPGVRKYNKLVRRFNAEVLRRRAYQSLVLAEELMILGLALDGTLGGDRITVTAYVAPEPDFGGKALFEGPGKGPAFFLVEHPPAGKNIASAHYAKTSVLLSTYPTGVAVYVDGTAACTTPCVLPQLDVGRKLVITGEAKMYQPMKAVLVVEPEPSGFKKFKHLFAK